MTLRALRPYLRLHSHRIHLTGMILKSDMTMHEDTAVPQLPRLAGFAQADRETVEPEQATA